MASDFVLVPRKPTFGMMDAFSGTRWINLPDAKQKAELEAYAAMLAAAPPEVEVTRCNICGFVVDTRFEAVKPTIEWGTAGRGKIEKMRWLDIQTAPTDGTPLLLFARHVTATASCRVVGHYAGPELGWLAVSFTPHGPQQIVPTKWQPLPDFP